MNKFFGSLGISRSELQLLESLSPPAVSADAVRDLSDTGEFQQGLWRMPSGESIGFEMISWETQAPRDEWRPGEADATATAAEVGKAEDTWEEAGLIQDPNESLLSLLPVECLAIVAAELNLSDLAAACAASAAFRRLIRGDACWVQRLRRRFGPGHLRGCFPRVACDTCCPSPFARIFFHALLGLYRARPHELLPHHQATSERPPQWPQVMNASMNGALFPRPLLSPVFLGQPLLMEFQLPAVHPGSYEILLRAKKLVCDPLDTESVASAAGSSGIRVPLLQARINRRNVTISNFECSIEVSTTGGSGELEILLSAQTMSHLLQNCSMPSDRWFYWRLALLQLRPEDGARDLQLRVSVLRQALADATVTQEEFERELRNALLVDHLFMRLQHDR